MSPEVTGFESTFHTLSASTGLNPGSSYQTGLTRPGFTNDFNIAIFELNGTHM